MSGQSPLFQDAFIELIDRLEKVCIWIVSDPGEFAYISDGFESIWGISPEKLKENPHLLVETIHPDDRDYVADQMQKSPDEVTSESYENRIVMPDETVQWVQTRQFPVRDEEGNLENIVGISTDITEQKRREEAYAVLNRILRHDIRNDMTIILGWLEILEDHIDEGGQEYLPRISTAGTHILELTKVSQDYAHVIANEGTMDVEPMALRSILEKEVDIRGEAFPRAEFEIDGEIPNVEVLANEMLSSVFKNILNNAIQHNDKDTPKVEISCTLEHAFAVVTIADNGPGIPDEQKETVFGKEKKGLESPGTGIGLYLVQNLVNEFNGDVWIEDNDLGGSSFVVKLPLAK